MVNAVLVILLLFGAVLIGVAGLLLSSQASLGSSIVGFACLLAIWARMAQAAGHHRELMKREPMPR